MDTLVTPLALWVHPPHAPTASAVGISTPKTQIAAIGSPGCALVALGTPQGISVRDVLKDSMVMLFLQEIVQVRAPYWLVS